MTIKEIEQKIDACNKLEQEAMYNYLNSKYHKKELEKQIDKYCYEDQQIIFSYLIKKRIASDVMSFFNDNVSEDEIIRYKEIADKIANAIIYEGDYYHELTYFDNIKRLIIKFEN